MRPEPAPTTWMIEAHSVFLSMSPTEAFWTLRILPRIGSSAWNSRVAGQLGGAQRRVALDDEELGALVVAAAAVDELGRQRRGLERVLAALGLLVLAGRDPGLGRAGDLLHDQLGLGLLGPLGRGEERLELRRPPPCVRRPRAAGVPRISLVWPSNCGSASRTVTTAVRPSRTSSLMTSSSSTLSTLVASHRVVEGLGQRALEAADVGAALGRGDHVDEGAQLGVVAGAPAHRDVDGELALDLLGRHVALVVEQRHGLGEGVRALQPQDVGDRLVVGEELDELGDAAVVAELLLDRRPRRAGRGSPARGPAR